MLLANGEVGQALRTKSQYSGASKWLAAALSWALWVGAQRSDERAGTLAGEKVRRGAVPESVRLPEEVVERLTDAPL